MGPEGQTSLFAPEPAPDPLLCWLWLAHVMGPASSHAGRVLDALEPIALLALLAVCTAFLVSGSANPFLYFRF